MRCLRIENRNNSNFFYCVLNNIICFVNYEDGMKKKLLWCSSTVNFFSTIIINKINNIIHIRDRQISVILTIYITRGIFRNFSRGGLFFYLFKLGLSTLWGLKPPRNQQISLVQGGLAPIAPLNTPLYITSCFSESDNNIPSWFCWE